MHNNAHKNDTNPMYPDDLHQADGANRSRDVGVSVNREGRGRGAANAGSKQVGTPPGRCKPSGSTVSYHEPLVESTMDKKNKSRWRISSLAKWRRWIEYTSETVYAGPEPVPSLWLARCVSLLLSHVSVRICRGFM
jgi:hypothetical protein